MTAPRSADPDVSGAGMIVGTGAYMSPEQARGQSIDRGTDNWAFGCVLYEMLTGRRAFSGNTISDTIAAILEREPDWTALPPALSPDVHRLVRRCLEKDPHHRIHDIADARVEIEEALAALSRRGGDASRSWKQRVVGDRPGGRRRPRLLDPGLGGLGHAIVARHECPHANRATDQSSGPTTRSDLLARRQPGCVRLGR